MSPDFFPVAISSLVSTNSEWAIRGSTSKEDRIAALVRAALSASIRPAHRERRFREYPTSQNAPRLPDPF
jgi:hypothetical protein